jgi:hypothetical protein
MLASDQDAGKSRVKEMMDRKKVDRKVKKSKKEIRKMQGETRR